MAVLALPALFSALGATGAFAIGAATVAGALIDSNVLQPALFPPSAIEGPRVADFKVQFVEEGAPHNLLLGNDGRASGAIVWAGPVRQVDVSSGGGGGLS